MVIGIVLTVIYLTSLIWAFALAYRMKREKSTRSIHSRKSIYEKKQKVLDLFMRYFKDYIATRSIEVFYDPPQHVYTVAFLRGHDILIVDEKFNIVATERDFHEYMISMFLSDKELPPSVNRYLSILGLKECL